MQVDLLLARINEKDAGALLVLPHGPEAVVPRHLQGAQWSFLVTTTVNDKLFEAVPIEMKIALDGYAIIPATGIELQIFMQKQYVTPVP